jgi:glycerol-3-phosphate O-acyltransferase
MRPEDQERALTEVKSRSLEALLSGAAHGGPPLDETIAESIYHERRRLHEEPESKARRDDQLFWARVGERFPRSSARTQREILERIIGRYAEEIAGNFDERVYQTVTRAIPPALGLLLNAVSPKRLLEAFPRLPKVDDNVIVQGEVEQLRRLHELGTVILVPTHVSNLDSIIIGTAIYRLGLPPFIYGAGLNLFSNPMIGYFMHNLGAYTVDRKKKDPLYIEVLKEYAAVTLEFGYDNIFFPGGTRSRSGAIERRLKLGLLGTGLTAYISNLRRKAPTPRVFIVPATFSFQLVLEAETLIEDFLKEVGKSRYIISDDEFSQPRRVFDFITQVFNLDSRMYVTVSRGLDPFGNFVDESGNSVDPVGRRVDPSRYVLVRGEPRPLASRDAEYTRELGEQVIEAYSRDNFLQSTNVSARAVFGLLRRSNSKLDLLRLVRSGGLQEDVELRAAQEATDQLLGQLRELARKGRIRLDGVVARGSAEDVLQDGLRHFAIYHATPAITRRGDRLFPTDRNLLFYYQNRLEGYGLWPEPDVPPALSRDHRTLAGAKGAAA